MPTQLTRFKIEGLHNLRTVDIPDIKDNRLILVGENGTGKSTVANLICYFLTFQWTRMLETNFRSVSATINNKHYEFSRDRVRSFANRTARISRAAGENRFPDRVGKKLQNIFSSYSIPTIEEKFDVIATESRIPSAFLRDEILRFKELSESFEFDDELESLKNSVTGKTLYLPTYRRIEQDLHKILRGVDRRELQRFKRTEFQFQLRERNRGGKLIELVEFGMDDVDKTIREQLRVLEQKLVRI